MEESAHRDDDAMILAKYAHIDEGKIKEMNLKVEQLQETVTRKRRMLSVETTETMAAQVKLCEKYLSFVLCSLTPSSMNDMCMYVCLSEKCTYMYIHCICIATITA